MLLGMWGHLLEQLLLVGVHVAVLLVVVVGQITKPQGMNGNSSASSAATK